MELNGNSYTTCENAFKAYEMRKLYMVCGETAKLFEPKTVDDVPNEPAKK